MNKVILWLVGVLIVIGSIALGYWGHLYYSASLFKPQVELIETTANENTDLPPVTFSVVSSLPYYSYDSATRVTCAKYGKFSDEELDLLPEEIVPFDQKCVADLMGTKITLPELASLPEMKNYDKANYITVVKFKDIIYVEVFGKIQDPNFGMVVDHFEYTYNPSTKTFTKIFTCSSNCVSVGWMYFLHYFTDTSGVHIYRDYLDPTGKLVSEELASLPKNTDGWQLGSAYAEGGLAEGSNWLSTLDSHNGVLHFTKKIPKDQGDYPEALSKYYLISF